MRALAAWRRSAGANRGSRRSCGADRAAIDDPGRHLRLDRRFRGGTWALCAPLEAGEAVTHPFVIGNLPAARSEIARRSWRSWTPCRRLSSATDVDVRGWIESGRLWGEASRLDRHAPARQRAADRCALWTLDARLRRAASGLGVAVDLVSDGLFGLLTPASPSSGDTAATSLQPGMDRWHSLSPHRSFHWVLAVGQAGNDHVELVQPHRRSPANCTSADTPPMRMSRLLLAARGAAPEYRMPAATAGVVAPKPVPNSSTVSPGCAGRDVTFAPKSPAGATYMPPALTAAAYRPFDCEYRNSPVLRSAIPCWLRRWHRCRDYLHRHRSQRRVLRCLHVELGFADVGNGCRLAVDGY